MRYLLFKIIFCLCLFFQVLADAAIKLPKVFSDHMIFQQGQPIRIWGSGAKNGMSVEITLGDVTLKTVVKGNGSWLIDFPSRKASFEAVDLGIEIGKDKQIIKNVLVGEVWIAAGQSNMAFPLRRDRDGKTALKEVNDSGMRLYHVQGIHSTNESFKEADLARLVLGKYGQGRWRLCDAESVKDFSAVAYYFAKKLKKFVDVPIGIICVAKGGSPIEAWIPQQVFKKYSNLRYLSKGNWLDRKRTGDWVLTRAMQNLNRAIKEGKKIPADKYGPYHPFKPSYLYDTTIKPLRNFGVAGVVWYQGESNAESVERVVEHELLFKLMVKTWRKTWRKSSSEFPFLYVQLPSMNRPYWPLFRDQQRRLLEAVPRSGMAITIDLGSKNDVHPNRKQEVGNRLARLALKSVYDKDVIPSGPLLKKAVIKGKRVYVYFDHCGKGLRINSRKRLDGFEVAGADRQFFPVEGKILGDGVVLQYDKVCKPTYVRYGWSGFPEPALNLVNSENLPASPFTTLLR